MMQFSGVSNATVPIPAYSKGKMNIGANEEDSWTMLMN